MKKILHISCFYSYTLRIIDAIFCQGGEEVFVNPYSDPILEPVKLYDEEEGSGLDVKQRTAEGPLSSASDNVLMPRLVMCNQFAVRSDVRLASEIDKSSPGWRFSYLSGS